MSAAMGKTNADLIKRLLDEYYDYLPDHAQKDHALKVVSRTERPAIVQHTESVAEPAPVEAQDEDADSASEEEARRAQPRLLGMGQANAPATA